MAASAVMEVFPDTGDSREAATDMAFIIAIFAGTQFIGTDQVGMAAIGMTQIPVRLGAPITANGFGSVTRACFAKVE